MTFLGRRDTQQIKGGFRPSFQVNPLLSSLLSTALLAPLNCRRTENQEEASGTLVNLY